MVWTPVLYLLVYLLQKGSIKNQIAGHWGQVSLKHLLIGLVASVQQQLIQHASLQHPEQNLLCRTEVCKNNSHLHSNILCINFMNIHNSYSWSTYKLSSNALFSHPRMWRASPIHKYKVSPSSIHQEIQMNGKLHFNWFCGQKNYAVFTESVKRLSVSYAGVNSAELHVLNERERVLSAAHI